jgi:hypothetical protein
MKAILSATIFFIFFGTFILCSCHKNGIVLLSSFNQQPPPPPPPPSLPPQPLPIAPYPPDTTGGIILPNAIWEIDSLDLGPDMKSILALVYPSNVFSIVSMVSRPVQVFIQLDSTPGWIYVPVWDWYGSNYIPPNNGYIWYFPHYPYGDRNFFEIENYPQNFQLVGRPVNVKVKIF